MKMPDRENKRISAAQSKFRMRTIAGSGVGMVAARDISAGDIVLRESPILIIPPQLKTESFTW